MANTNPTPIDGLKGLSKETMDYYGVKTEPVVTFQEPVVTATTVEPVTVKVVTDASPATVEEKQKGPIRDANTNTLTTPSEKVVQLPESSNAANVVPGKPAEKKKNFLAKIFSGLGNFFKSLFGKKKSQ